jgi:hypothetical protein
MTKPEIRMNDEAQMTKFGFRHSGFLRISGFVLLIYLFAGCSSNKHPTTRPVDPQQAALNDPFGYKPDMSDSRDISGGDIGHYDKHGMRKDLDHVLNP